MYKLVTRDQLAPFLAKFRAWLLENKDVVKAGGLAHRAGLDDAAMSQIVAGTRLPRPRTLTNLINEASKYGFDLNKTYPTDNQ